MTVFDSKLDTTERSEKTLFIVGCTPYSTTISLAVFSPLIASSATFAFRSALYRLCWVLLGYSFLARSLIQLVYLIDLSIITSIMQRLRELKHDSHERLAR